MFWWISSSAFWKRWAENPPSIEIWQVREGFLFSLLFFFFYVFLIVGRNEGAFPDIYRALTDLGISIDSIIVPGAKSLGLDSTIFFIFLFFFFFFLFLLEQIRFPVKDGPELVGSVLGETSEPLPATAPSWLPPLPLLHAYQQTPQQTDQTNPEKGMEFSFLSFFSLKKRIFIDSARNARRTSRSGGRIFGKVFQATARSRRRASAAGPAVH
jgi:hypothetical protein